MNTLELLLKLHDAIGNSYPDWNTIPTKIAVLVPEIRLKIKELEKQASFKPKYTYTVKEVCDLEVK